MSSVKGKVYRAPRQLLIHRQKTGTALVTTLTAPSAAGDTTIDCVAVTNGAVGDTIRIGVEINRIASIASLEITLAFPLTFDHAIGEAVVEMTTFDYGDIEGAGATYRVNGEETDVAIATKRLAYVTIPGYQDFGLEFAFPNLSIHNFPIAFGMLGSVVSGSGTVASPRHFATDGNEFAGDAFVAATIIGTLMDGTVVYQEAWGCDVDYSGVSLSMVRGNNVTLPVRFVSQGGVAGEGAPGYTVDNSVKPTNGKVFTSLEEVGFFVPETTTALNSTVAAATAAAGQKTLELAAVTNAVSGEAVKIGVDDNAEFHDIDSVGAPNIVLRTNLLRDQIVGTPVVEQKRVPFAAVSEEGVAFETGGETTPIRIATSPTSLGTRPGAAFMSVVFAVVEITLSQLAYTLGIDQAAIASNRLPLIGALIGKTPIEGLYLRGLCQDGSTFEMRFWGCTQSVTEWAITLSNQGALTSAPFRLRPASGIQVLDYT